MKKKKKNIENKVKEASKKFRRSKKCPKTKNKEHNKENTKKAQKPKKGTNSEIKIIKLGSEKSNPKIQLEEEEFDEFNPLSQFLANPWKQVSFEAKESFSLTNLEINLPENEEDNKNLKPINYMNSPASKEGLYIAPGSDTKIENSWKSEEEKKFDNQKRLYSKNQSENNENDLKYVKPEDTIRTDYFNKKKFGD
ncbi:MAG: hypothetical protein U9Q99_00155 [Nanoarchaeota archaeon]|nr:hypothetical protein [Nanoarchaeota archaeon]